MHDAWSGEAVARTSDMGILALKEKAGALLGLSA